MTDLELVKLALSEDLGGGDVSADLLDDSKVSATIISREAGVICGVNYAALVFGEVDDNLDLKWQVKDGENIAKNQVICHISGRAKSIITAERCALNFLQMLSGVATKTNYLAQKIKHTKAQLLDTRKTLPMMRKAQKYAVKIGGGVNHRMGLFDCVMLKENHLKALGSIEKAHKKACEKYPKLPLIIEVENLSQLQQVLKLSGVTRVLLDNFTIKNLALAVKITNHKIPLEASGNINETNIKSIAETGVDFISIGALTKDLKAIDLSLIFT